MTTYGIIPARLRSTRLSDKLLLNETGKPLIQHTWESARLSARLVDLIIATDSEDIARVATQFGARCELTGEHPSGTDRIAEVVARSLPDAEIIVNIQGDEPEIEPAHIDRVVELLLDAPSAGIATLAAPIRSIEELHCASCVKVVTTQDGRALYFSREPIPHIRGREKNDVFPTDPPWLRHVGLYAYRRDALLRLSKLPVTPLEQHERLEQLRALEDGMGIQVARVEHAAPGIDTTEDYRRFVSRIRASPRR